MNKSILIKLLLIFSFTLLTMLQASYAQQQPEKDSNEKIILMEQTLSKVKHYTLEQIKLDGDNDAVLDMHDQCPNSPAGSQVDQYGCTKYAKREPIKEKVITVSLLVNFDNNKYNVDERYFAELNRVANFLKQYPKTSIIIKGHTSSQGSAMYNKKLSQKRADAIVKVLTHNFAIDSTRLSAEGYGEEQLIDLADTEEAHTMNRRVEGKVSTAE